MSFTTFLSMASLVVGSGTAAAADRRPAGRDPTVVECADARVVPRAVRLHVYNQTRLRAADVDAILEVANRIWSAYGLTFEASAADDAVTVVLARGPGPGLGGAGRTVLGATLFTAGHATPFIRVWLGATEALAATLQDGGPPFESRAVIERDAILQRMLGVALAHELAHLLLDTSRHAPDGVFRAGVSLRDLEFPDTARLVLTSDQRRTVCPVRDQDEAH